MTGRVIVVLVQSPDGRTIKLRGRVAEVLLALAVHLGVREDALNRTQAWKAAINCGPKDIKLDFGDSVKPVEFRSGLGA